MPITAWILLWLSVETLGVIWELANGQLSPVLPISSLINFIYNHGMKVTRWTQARLDARGILGHIILTNLLLLAVCHLWESPAWEATWGIILLLLGCICLIIENLTWSQNGLKPYLDAMTLEKRGVILADEGVKIKFVNKIKNFTPTWVLPIILSRIAITALIFSLIFGVIYRQILFLNPLSFTDGDKNAIVATDWMSLFAYSTEITVSGSSNLEPMTAPARMVFSLNRTGNVILFSLFVGTIVTMSLEDVKQRKKELLSGLDNDEVES